MAKMLTKRIIPCLDVKEGEVVKGVNFGSLKYAGDPVELAKRYYLQGADELSFLDINASYEERKIMVEVIKKVAKEVFIPLSVGGGIDSADVIKELLNSGAEKVSIGTAAVKKPELVTEASRKFGSQAIVVSIDAKKTEDSWTVYIKGGREDTGLDALDFAQKMQDLGAGEILVNSIDRDGTKKGFDFELNKEMSERLDIPIIASGGAGTLKDFKDVLSLGKADAALAASLFHYKNYTIDEIKSYLQENGIEVRK
jgi:cyclase